MRPAHRGLDALGQEQLRRPQAFQLGRERLVALALEHAEAARAEVEPGEPEALAVHRECGEQAFAPRVEQGVVRHRARRHDAHDLARDRALRLADLAGLLADRDRLALLHQPREIAVELFHRHAGHRDGRAARFATLGEDDVEELRAAARVVVEKLVEVAHPVEQQYVRDSPP